MISSLATINLGLAPVYRDPLSMYLFSTKLKLSLKVIHRTKQLQLAMIVKVDHDRGTMDQKYMFKIFIRALFVQKIFIPFLRAIYVGVRIQGKTFFNFNIIISHLSPLKVIKPKLEKQINLGHTL